MINSNVKNFCSPTKFVNRHVNRINPDKMTFLKSNLIVSNILNSHSPKAIDIEDPAIDAYVPLHRLRNSEKKKSIRIFRLLRTSRPEKRRSQHWCNADLSKP